MKYVLKMALKSDIEDTHHMVNEYWPPLENTWTPKLKIKMSWSIYVRNWYSNF